MKRMCEPRTDLATQPPVSRRHRPLCGILLLFQDRNPLILLHLHRVGTHLWEPVRGCSFCLWHTQCRRCSDGDRRSHEALRRTSSQDQLCIKNKRQGLCFGLQEVKHPCPVSGHPILARWGCATS